MAEAPFAQAFWTVAPGRGEIRRTPLRAPGADEVLVRSLRSGISRGTESLVFRGQVPPSQWTAIRCPFQEGDFPGPLKYGYASVGRVEAGPATLLGRRVFCLYPHQDCYVVPADAVIPLPDAVSDTRGVLAANMETAVNGLWDATPRLGDRVAVIGAGVVGSLVAALAARIPGVRVELIDTDPRRAALADRLGCSFATPDEASADADLVLHASGHPDGLATGLRIAGFEASVVELSWYGDRPVALPLGEAFHARRLNLRSSQVGSVATAQRARWSHRRRMQLALDLLADPVFDALLSGESPFAELPTVLPRLADAPDGALCHVVTYP
ncbi:zinc-binding alcohol dehydrogenase [Zoogloea sp. LCSB751]|uniref:zinc-dependent alcohol dehydrogenase n=1 Tax=Zoogloea sp. LCSB751 TaxID=1965277 RepID=UPI0009A48474|nr:zinc-binding alcohol dehydrogenase [Zoogloea sp. LCSB751]